MDFSNYNEVSAKAIVFGSFVIGLFYIAPKVFWHYESRLKEISQYYREDNKRQDERHRADVRELLEAAKKERDESQKLFCESLKELTIRVGSLETKIDKLVT